MAKHTHIHLHLHPGMFGSRVADAFEESKHPREGGKFTSGAGSSGGAAAPTGKLAHAMKQKHDPAAGRRAASEESAQEKLDRARREHPLL